MLSVVAHNGCVVDAYGDERSNRVEWRNVAERAIVAYIHVHQTRKRQACQLLDVLVLDTAALHDQKHEGLQRLQRHHIGDFAIDQAHVIEARCATRATECWGMAARAHDAHILQEHARRTQHFTNVNHRRMLL